MRNLNILRAEANRKANEYVLTEYPLDTDIHMYNFIHNK